MKIHLIGICGTGMGPLAGLLKAAATKCAARTNTSTRRCRAAGRAGDPGASRGSPREPGLGPRARGRRQRLQQGPRRGAGARRNGASPSSRSRRCSASCSCQTAVGVVAGTHGKTTTSSLLAHVLIEAGRDPSYLVGGVPLNFRQSWRLGAGRRVRRRGRRVRHRVLRQGIEVPPLPPADRAPHVGRARPRRHLSRQEAVTRRVPQVRRAHPRGRAAGGVRRLAGRDGGRARARAARW